MSSRTATRLAWASVSVVALTQPCFAFVVLNGSVSTEGRQSTTDRASADVIFVIAVLTFPTIGALVASRRPENPIGWIFVGWELCSRSGHLRRTSMPQYALLTEPGSLSAGKAMAWLQSWLFLVPLILSGTPGLPPLPQRPSAVAALAARSSGSPLVGIVLACSARCSSRPARGLRVDREPVRSRRCGCRCPRDRRERRVRA